VALSRTGRILALCVFFALIAWWVGKDLVSWLTTGAGAPTINLLIDAVVLGLVVLAWVVLLVPHASRRRRSADGSNRISIRGNDELRLLLNRTVVAERMRNGTFSPRLGFGGFLVAEPDGLALWTGWGQRAGLIPSSALAGIEVTSRQEGFSSVPALKLVSTEAHHASFLITDVGSGLFIGNEDETAEAARVLRNTLGLQAKTSEFPRGGYREA